MCCRQNISTSHEPKTFKCEVKPPGFFAGNVIWNVSADRIDVGKGNQTQTYLLSDVIAVTPVANPSKSAQFKFASKNSDPSEQRCMTMDNMKKLLDAIYTNKFIQKYPTQEEPAPSSQQPEQNAAPATPAPANE